MGCGGGNVACRPAARWWSAIGQCQWASPPPQPPPQALQQNDVSLADRWTVMLACDRQQVMLSLVLNRGRRRRRGGGEGKRGEAGRGPLCRNDLRGLPSRHAPSSCRTALGLGLRRVSGTTATDVSDRTWGWSRCCHSAVRLKRLKEAGCTTRLAAGLVSSARG